MRIQETHAEYVVQPLADASDLIIFTEALVHGTRAWKADHERRALLYKYCPGHSAYSPNYYSPADYPEATEQQLRIMAAPSIGQRPDSIESGKIEGSTSVCIGLSRRTSSWLIEEVASGCQATV